MNNQERSRGPSLWHAIMLVAIGLIFSLGLAISGHRAGAFRRFLHGNSTPAARIAIEIDPGPPLNVVPEQLRLPPGGGEVVWQCRNGCTFSVDFDVSGPFQQSHFDQGQPYGKLRSTVKPGESFPYTVTVGPQSVARRVVVQQ
jgi:hypothetical protein